MRKEFLVVYNYGTGGGWAYLLADSEAHIHDRFPELKVVSRRPDWLSEEEEQHLRRRMTIDIDDIGNPFLAALVRQRK